MSEFLLLFEIAIFLVLPEQSNAQSLCPDDALVAAIDKLVEANGITAREPGVAVLIHQPGKLLFQKGYGLANIKSEKPITPRTMFELASVSKSFTATAVLILHDRGKLSVQDDVRKHLPEMPEYEKRRPIRIRDLLQHTSGLPDYMDFENVPSRHKDYWVNDDYLVLFAKRRDQFPLAFPTGEKYVYNNTNYMLLASIIERVGKQPFGRFLRDEVFTPAGMEHSFVYEGPRAIPDNPPGYVKAVGYTWRKKKEEWEATWGAPPARSEEMLAVGDGGIWTNLEDMAKWDIAIRAGKLLQPDTWKLALTPSKTRDGKTNDYGLGWMLYYEKPNAIYGYGHDGSWNGFITSYYRYLTADRTTVLLSNRSNFNGNKLWTSLDRVVEKHLSNSK